MEQQEHKYSVHIITSGPQIINKNSVHFFENKSYVRSPRRTSMDIKYTKKLSSNIVTDNKIEKKISQMIANGLSFEKFCEDPMIKGHIIKNK